MSEKIIVKNIYKNTDTAVRAAQFSRKIAAAVTAREKTDVIIKR